MWSQFDGCATPAVTVNRDVNRTGIFKESILQLCRLHVAGLDASFRIDG